jgi:hypothetical protein
MHAIYSGKPTMAGVWETLPLQAVIINEVNCQFNSRDTVWQ